MFRIKDESLFDEVVNTVFEFGRIPDYNIDNVSKVVDENGEPLVVWHSSGNQFTEFDSHYETSEESEWRIWRTDTEEEEKEARREIRSFFTSDKKYAESMFEVKHPDTVYVDEDGKPVKTIKNSVTMYMYGVFLNIKNPLYTNQPLELRQLRSIEATENYDNTHDGIVGHDLYNLETEEAGLRRSEGIEYVAFKKNQIKSATDNVGTFSRENNDIRYREAEQVDREMSVKQYHFQKLMYVNLSEEDKEYIKERGMSVRDYSSMSQAEKELFWKCR